MTPIWLTRSAGFEAAFDRLLLRGGDESGDAVRSAVASIIADVERRGDEAVLEHTARLDDRPNLRASDITVESRALDEAFANLEASLRGALERAAQRIRSFHAVQASQVPSSILDDGRGIRLELVVRPLSRVAVYVPGGTAAYPSTVLMNVIPAKIAGVPEIIMVTPAQRGRIAPAVLAAARIAGADRVHSIGGAQAIAALSRGTERIPRVDKIVGPGNAFVQEAKRQVFGRVAIDQIAGPSEVAIIADRSARPRVVAADMIAQAEHDVRAAALLFTSDESLAYEVAREIEEQIRDLPRAAFAQEAISRRGAIIVTRDRRESFDLANRYAPEHLGLAIENADLAVDLVTSAGAVFVGQHTPEALGDYNAGINHVLPTGGTARFGSPLSVHDFVRRMNVLRVERGALERLGADATRLARAEGLEAHARAIELRLESS